MLQIEGYHKAYHGQTILRIPAVTFDQPRTWIKGGNGAGKSTLFKSLAALIPFEGTITLNGKEMRKHLQHWRSVVNYAEAEPIFPAFLTGEDLIRWYQQTKRGTPEQVNKLIDTLGVRKYMHQKVGGYSSGMAKKLSLVLAFIGCPELILLDEPLATLDVEAQAIILALTDEYVQQGVQVILTSHQGLAAVSEQWQYVHTCLIADKNLTQL
ncbi:ABC-2 type transport system ATP-binding protein [Chitinophaga skermanii]|uniref:ABC-2 type transport system ATP-binding protein n=1 Tax=Chitinophaga skermanii TaxID=331697 RepID=A0A327QUZ0_9BACT|nr:ABC transporter ATP-binding protein [Chitinophaga skermanii]RAJ08429.1 ABC-2 type transport system ATP-binding protein [Chitinophaga skermanii]